MSEYRQCAFRIVVCEDAQGNDLCESLGLPEYPDYQCPGNAAANGCEMCHEHDAFSVEWVEDWPM